MSLIINAEHFELKPSIRKQFEDILQKILARAKKTTNLHLFMKREARGNYKATLVVHSDHDDLTCTARGDYLPAVVLAAKAGLSRQLADRKERRMARRRSQPSFDTYRQLGGPYESIP